MANIIFVSKYVLDADQEDFLMKSVIELGIAKKSYDTNVTQLKPEEWNFVKPDVSEGEIVAFNYDIDPDMARNTANLYAEQGAFLIYPMGLLLSDRNIDEDDPIWLVNEWHVMETNLEEIREMLKDIHVY